ncbi:MAG: preprotein translocase subunit YajC [Bacteroidota bacterium]
MTHLLFVLLMTGGGDSKNSNPLMTFLPLILIVVVFYFFMIRPQMKRSKDQKKFREAIKKGDKIVTIGGIHGKIIEVHDTTFIIETEGLGKLKIERSAVATGTNPDQQLNANK